MQIKEYKVGLFIWTAVAITVLCVIYAFVTYRLEDKGVFGDMFGALTAWFSGLAFAGIIYTILQQKTELGYQREELRQTREEFRTQNVTLRKQRFENTYFNLLTQHNRIIDGLSFTSTVEVNEHRFDAFRFAHVVLNSIASRELGQYMMTRGRTKDSGYNSLTEQETEDFLDTVVKVWYNHNPHNLHLYFQSLKRILKFVHKSALLDNQDERHFYASLLKDQISYYERAVILYVGLLPDDWYKGITYYVKMYQILDGIDERSLVSIRDKRLFDKWANPNEPRE
jgi:hypothetical protein